MENTSAAEKKPEENDVAITPAAPGTPELISGTEDSEIYISWKAVEGALGYKIQMRIMPPAKENEWERTIELTKTEYEEQMKQGPFPLKDLQPTTTYQFRVGAKFDGGKEMFSDDILFDTQVTSCVPTNSACPCCSVC